MRILPIVLCICLLSCVNSWGQGTTAADSTDPSVSDSLPTPGLTEAQLADSKSLVHIIYATGAQDGMAPQKSDVPPALARNMAGDPSGLRNRP